MDARSIVWLDAAGGKTITRVLSGAGLGAAFAPLEALSNAGVQEWWESAVTAPASPPTNAAFASAADRAALVFVCADNTQTTVIVPAPKLSIFKADGETVDPANVLVVALVTAAIAAPIQNPSGSPVTALVAGQRLPRSRTPL